MVDPPSSPPPPRGPFGVDRDLEPDPVAAAQEEAARIIADAELRAEQRTERILAEAQVRLDSVLDAERASHARLRRAVDEVSDTIDRLEQGDFDLPEASQPSEDLTPNVTASGEESAVAPDPEAQTSAPSDETTSTHEHRSEAPRSMFADDADERGLIDAISAAIRARVLHSSS